MVRKFINIDANVARVVAATEVPPTDDLTPEQQRVIAPQLRTGRIAGEFARFYMDEINRGTEPAFIINAMLVVAGQSIFQPISAAEECEEPKFPDDPVHSMVHKVANAFSQVLHAALAQARGIPVDGIKETGDPIQFDTKEVGDA